MSTTARPVIYAPTFNKDGTITTSASNWAELNNAYEGLQAENKAMREALQRLEKRVRLEYSKEAIGWPSTFDKEMYDAQAALARARKGA